MRTRLSLLWNEFGLILGRCENSKKYRFWRGVWGDSSLGYQFLLAWLRNLTQYFVRHNRRKTKLRPEAANNSSNYVSCQHVTCFLLLRIPFVFGMKLKLPLQGYRTRKPADWHRDVFDMQDFWQSWKFSLTPHSESSVCSCRQSCF